MKKAAITTDRTAPPAGPFSSAIQAGELLYVSGHVAQDPAGRLVEGDVTTQAEVVFRNLLAVLQAAGRNFSDVVRVGVYLTDMADFQAMNAVYARHFQPPYPARTTIGVAALPLGARLEVDLVVG